MILSIRRMVIFGIFFVILGGTAIWGLDSLTSIKTEGEVIEISKNSPTVQEHLQNADWYTVRVEYYNKTRISELKTNSSKFEFLPEDHGAWKVTWHIHPEGSPSAVAYIITHWIDEESGQILHEGLLLLR